MKVNYYECNILFLCFVAISFHFVEIKCQVSLNSTENEVCVLQNNQFGVCRELQDCAYALEKFRQNKFNEISRCDYKESTRKICCPNSSLITTINPSVYPKSQKFLNAICISKAFPVALTLAINTAEPAGVGEFPFQVAIGYRNHDNEIEYKCGGSLIADDIVLTAAHCANRIDTIPETIKLGRASLVPDEYDYGEGEDIEIQVISSYLQHYCLLIIFYIKIEH